MTSYHNDHVARFDRFYPEDAARNHQGVQTRKQDDCTRPRQRQYLRAAALTGGQYRGLVTPTADDILHAKTLWDYLRLLQPVRPVECLLVFGGHDLGVAERAAEVHAAGIAPLIVVSGGSRAVPDGSDFSTEADAIADVLLRHNVPEDAILLERLATNTSENFWLSAELLRDHSLDPQSFLIVQKPYAERRTLATARRRWPDKDVSVTSQRIGFHDYCAGSIPVDRILSMLAGEVLRLETYTADGLIDSGEPVPHDILSAARALQATGHNQRALN
jgi:uncharacterized SAM-binding protein YcdF (DUF218 family)